jgi:hypothetical protein
MYKPKKKKYNSLKHLYREMLEDGVIITEYNGAQILTKKHKYTMLDSIVTVKER